MIAILEGSALARIAIMTGEYEPFRGGIATFVAELACAAAQIGHTVSVIAPDYGGVASCENHLPYEVRRYPAQAYSALQYPAYFRSAREIMREDFHQILAADIAFIDTLSALRCTNFTAFVHGSEAVRGQKSLKGKILSSITTFSRPAHIFANSAYTRNLLLANHRHVAPSDVTVAPLGVSQSRFGPVDTAALRTKLGIQNERVIACVGRITPRKGQATLLKACQNPHLDKAENIIVIAGRSAGRDTVYLRELKLLAGTLQHARVIFTDSLDDEEIRSLYATADVFCLPGSTHSTAVEGFGLVFLEAAAQGAPSVAGNIGGVSEVIETGATGILVQPDDAGELAKALTRLLDDRSARVAMSNQARSLALRFTWQRCAETVFGAT